MCCSALTLIAIRRRYTLARLHKPLLVRRDHVLLEARLTSTSWAPPQNVILDTGSADFWLADTNCTTAECLLVRTFAANNSESSVPAATDFSIRYGQVRTPPDLPLSDTLPC